MKKHTCDWLYQNSKNHTKILEKNSIFVFVRPSTKAYRLFNKGSQDILKTVPWEIKLWLIAINKQQTVYLSNFTFFK